MIENCQLPESAACPPSAEGGTGVRKSFSIRARFDAQMLIPVVVDIFSWLSTLVRRRSWTEVSPTVRGLIEFPSGLLRRTALLLRSGAKTGQPLSAVWANF